MLAIKLWNYLRGYVIIRIKGLSLERFINLALVNDIFLWDVKRISHIEIRATVSIDGYKNLENLVNRLGCRVEIIERKGLPFTINSLKKRKMLGFGLILFIVLVGLLASIIWEIDIIGTEQIPDKEIIRLLEDNNIKIGSFKKSINKDKVENLLLEKYDYITFIDVNTVGVRLVIELKEEDIPPEKVDKSYPANIISKKKGVIIKIVAKKGKSMVDKGKIVEEGELLISGYMDSELSDEVYLVHSEGEILAQTRYSAIIELPIVEQEKKETGKVYKQKGIKVGKKGIKFFAGEIPYKDYIEEVNEKNILNFKDISLGIKFINYIYREVELKGVKRDLDFLKKSAQLEAVEKINDELADDVEIVSKDIFYDIKGNVLETKVVIEVIEDIGKIQIIPH